MRTIAICVLFLIGACSSKTGTGKDLAKVEIIAPDTISYRGKISPESVNNFEKVLLDSSEAISTLIISSGGGEVFAGMRLGRLVHEHKLKVIVREVCGSSCANYVVTASPHVFVEKNALLGWHGGALQPLYLAIEMSFWERFMLLFAENDDGLDAYLAKWKKEESAFFQSINVDQTITVLGIMPGLNEMRNAVLFSYDPLTLKKLGLNIQFEGEQTGLSPKGELIVQVFKLKHGELDQLLKRHDKRMQAAADGSEAD